MVLPLYDDNSDLRLFPFVNYAFIVINVLVFIGPQQMGAEHNRFTNAFACVPEEIKTGKDVVGPIAVIEHPITHEVIDVIKLEPTPFSVYITLITSMFMHGGWAHLLGNMLFLWIFGDNIEDYLGHVRYIIFYLLCGVLASLSHVAATYAFGSDPRIPSLGASGAISGVLGGYILLFPHRRVVAIVFRFLTEIPAWVAIGVWFAFQLINGLGVIGDKAGGGVAYGAHIGGFVSGLLLIKVIGAGIGPPPNQRRPAHWQPQERW